MRDGLRVLAGRAELEDVVAGTLEGLEGKGPSFLLLGGGQKMGSSTGDGEDTAGAAEAGGLAGEVPSIPQGMFCLGGGGGADKAWELADVSASGAGGDLVSVTGPVEEAGVRVPPQKTAVGLQSEEVPARGPDCEEPRGARGLGVFGGEWATGLAMPADMGGDGRPGESCCFFKLFNSGLGLGAGREVSVAGVPAVGRLKETGG